MIEPCNPVHRDAHRRRLWRTLRTITLASAALLCAPFVSNAARIVLIEGPAETAPGVQLDVAARFYGLDLTVVRIPDGASAGEALQPLKDPHTVGVAMTGRALAALVPEPVLAALRRPNGQRIPLLILGITPTTDMPSLRRWAGSAAPTACRPLDADALAPIEVASDANRITGVLAHQSIPAAVNPACAFPNSAMESVTPLLWQGSAQAKATYFERILIRNQEIFILTENARSPAHAPTLHSTVETFSRYMPLLLFVRYAAGDYAWHTETEFANLTIDDPWLTQPYGSLDYYRLLDQMGRANFHTTIAFIPWNFDRSEPELARLFREHPDRFSICIHGNNHDHLEFGSYAERPKATQVANIRQAMARMEQFQRLTGVPFDPVMVFPDEIAPPAATLDALEAEGFAAAVNASVLPLDAHAEHDPIFFLRSVSEDFTTLPFIRRYPAQDGIPPGLVAINDFLGNPLLFYGHQAMFEGGMDAFNSMAQGVNRIDPEVQWKGLGAILLHLYRTRLVAGDEYEVLAESNDFILENKTGRRVRYTVERSVNPSLRLTSFTAEGRPLQFRLRGSTASSSLWLDPGASARVSLHYDANEPGGTPDVAKHGMRITLLRRISDFRDITLSRTRLGRSVIAVYYSRHFDTWELLFERLLPYLLVAIVLAIAAIFLRRTARLHRRKTQRA